MPVSTKSSLYRTRGGSTRKGRIAVRESAERLLRCTEKPGIGNAGGVVTDDVIRFAITGSHGISEIRHVLTPRPTPCAGPVVATILPLPVWPSAKARPSPLEG